MIRTTDSTKYLPTITVQHDFPDVVEDIKKQVCLAEDIWISCYVLTDQSGTTRSIHGKVRVSSNDDDRLALPNLDARDGVECQWADNTTHSELSIVVGCPSLSIPSTLVRFPSRVLDGIHPNGVDCMDVTKDWIVTGGNKGNLRIDSWRKPASAESNQIQYRVGRGHVSDLTSCQFFPSGEVILTTSIDMSARVFSIYPDQANPTSSLLLSPRTFAAPHTRAVTTASIIGKGKEIITACRDGKLRVWNVAESKVIHEESYRQDGMGDILAIKIGQKKFLDRLGDELTDLEIKAPFFLVLGFSSGALNLVDVPSLKPFKLASSPFPPSDSPIEVIAVSPCCDLIAYGTRSGRVTLMTVNWQLVSSSPEGLGGEPEEVLSLSLLASWQRTTAGVNSLQFTDDGTSLVVAGNDGLPYRVRIGDQPTILEEFAGYNCDPVTCISSLTINQPQPESFAFCAGQDGGVKIYNLY